VLVKLRYVTKRTDEAGERWYWQRRGHPLTRLPDDPVERIATAERLNAAADGAMQVNLRRGTIAWVIREYLQSDDYRDLAQGTVAYYKRYLRDIAALGNELPFSAFTRQAVIDFIKSYEKTHQRRQAAAVLKNLFGMLATMESLPSTRLPDCGSK
jgi:hypothetical protein